ncbi:Integrase/recombinase [Fructobacillus fructosus]|uniref:site-specific integrase n=1 Tax=Fructobacillus fructosus TaxID=1631 RepID=UPI002DA4D667|nr:Integrase/recombinase [Fructobacillus fructosus]CAK1247864.1 Integrase/recombinase [Fructobacillus fructosus]
MATFEKRGNKWRARVSFKENGTFRQKSKGSFKTKKEALEWANEQEHEKYHDRMNIRDGLFSDLYWSWFETFKEPQLETNSKSTYKQGLNLINKYFNDMKISEIRASMFQRAINDYGKTHAMITVSKVKNVIQQFVIYAVDEEYIGRDFTRSTKSYSAIPAKDKSLKFLENDELESLKKNAMESDDVTSHMILTGIYSGCRYSEIAALTKGDFDFKNHTLTVNKAWQATDREIKKTKTPYSVRTIDMPKKFFDMAKDWHFGKNFAFTYDDKMPPTNNACNKKLAKLLGDNSKTVTFHALRHTHASYLLANDIALQYVSERLGHSGVNITLRTYAHLLDDKRTSERAKTISLLEGF